MIKVIRLVSILTVAVAPCLGAQAVPEGSQAWRVPMQYRRPVQLRVDPFRHALVPHWGLVISGGGQGLNNALNADDARALIFIADTVGLQPSDLIEALNLVPPGSGIVVNGEAEAGAYLGGPIGSHFAIGFSGKVRGYAFGELGEEVVDLLRNGNVGQQSFALAGGGSTLETAEAGGHILLRFGPLGSVDGAVLTFGFGGRLIWPLFYAKATTDIGSNVQIAPGNFSGVVDIDVLRTDSVTVGTSGGSGFAADFLFRIEWPTSGLAFEAMVANIGSVTVNGVTSENWSVNVATAQLTEVLDSLDADPVTPGIQLPAFTVMGTGQSVEVDLPRIVRFTGSAWANRILQIDLSATLPVHKDFDLPLAIDLGTTWRFIRSMPLHAGLILDGRQGVGYTAGFGFESRNMLFRTYGGTLGGWLGGAKGAAARVELGFFF